MSKFLVSVVSCFFLQAAIFWQFNMSQSIAIGLVSSTILSLLFSLIWKLYLWPFWFSPLRKLPEPSAGHSFYGHEALLLPSERSGFPHREWINNVSNNGLIRYRKRFNKEVVFVTSPKALSEILIQKNYQFPKPYKLRTGLGRILGVGLIFAEGNEHKVWDPFTQRKHLMPAFSHRHIKDLYPIFWNKSVTLARVMDEDIGNDLNKSSNPSSKVFNVEDWLARATLDILGAAGFGEEFDSLHHPDNEICIAYRNVFELKPPQGFLAMGLLLIRHAFKRTLNLPIHDRITVATATLTGVARKLISNSKEKAAMKGHNEQDIISVALATGNFTDSMLEDHLLNFLAAGHETTATSTTWALYALCEFPEIQERLRTEIRQLLPSILGDTSLVMTAELLDSLPYLHAFCNEVFRLYPPAGFTRRVVVKKAFILGQLIPEGTEIVISPRAMNVSKELWGDDADVFSPDRWLRPNQANSGGGLTNFSFMTFLHGPRSCIGQQFARGEFASLVAALVGTFEITLAQESDIQTETLLTCRPKGGLLVRFCRL